MWQRTNLPGRGGGGGLHHPAHRPLGQRSVVANFSDGSKLTATLIGKDEKTDIAVLQVKPKAKFRAALASSAPTGMSGVTRPFRLTRVMTQSVVAF